MRVVRLLSHPARDAALALLLVAPSLLLGAGPFGQRPIHEKMIVLLGSAESWRQHLLWWWIATVAAVVALLIRRRWPLPAFGLAAASVLAHLLTSALPLLPIDLAAGFTLYTLAAHARSRWIGAAALAGALIALYPVCLLASVGRPGLDLATRATVLIEHPPSDVVLTALSTAAVPALMAGVAWATGDNIRTRRRYLATIEQRARDLVRERDQRAALAAADERARLTRDLHDVIAHGVSVIVVQAQAAAAALPPDSDESAKAVAHIVDTGRTTLAEMRHVVGAVRDGLDHDTYRATHPGLSALPDLIDQVRNAGTPVAFHVEGDTVPLPSGADLSVYRIVQEALTNVRKHAGSGAHATVRLMFAPTHLEVDVSDDGSGTPTPEGTTRGNGLRGIVERVDAIGGKVDAGPRVGGGFGIHALVPIRAGT